MSFSLMVRRRATVPSVTEDLAERVLRAKLMPFDGRVVRASVHLEDANGRRGHIDTVCQIRVALSKHPALVVEARARTAGAAIERAAEAMVRRVGEVFGARPARRAEPRVVALPRTGKRRPLAPPPRGSLIGRRVGRGPQDLEAALARPDKHRRDAVVDTAEPGMSATDRRAGGASTARRNAKRPFSGASAMLEDSATGRPSRKSTRRGANRQKRDANLRLRQERALGAPKARVTRAKASATRPRTTG